MDYGIGSVIEYSPFGGGTRQVKVDEKNSDIKNGRPGFGGDLLGVGERMSVWGYDSQITAVLSR